MTTVDTTNIDETKPIEGTPTTQSVRGNFAEIKAQLDNAGTDIDAGSSALAAHLADTSDSHDASAISNVAAGNIVATDVQAAIDELDAQDTTNATAISDHIADATDAHDASAVSYVNTTSGLTATAVQAAMDEYDPILKHSSGNGIYNGKMTISQRGDFTSATAVASVQYYLDRWKTTLQVVTGTITHIADGHSTGLDTSKYIATSTGIGQIGADQFIEGYSAYLEQEVTISARVKSNTSEARLALYDGTVLDVAAHSGDGTFELLSVTGTIRDIATDIRAILRITTSGLSQTSITSGDYIECTDVRLDLGSHRLSGDREPKPELELCRGYWYQPSSAAAYAPHGIGVARLVTELRVIVDHPELQAIADTVSYNALRVTDNVTTWAVSGVTISSSGKGHTMLIVTCATGLTVGNAYQLTNNNDVAGYLGLGNEL